GNQPNTRAVGAIIRVRTGNLTQTREITLGSNFTSNNPTVQVFGLGDAAVIDELQIEWPSINGLPAQVDIYTNLAPGSIRCVVGDCNF
ncbi:MAG: ASPIC/UnbV domain-containing protein, partial [Porticoccaceae bacterium]|nr:ASPIC/UnbV domain-containing protein [Porticoccaceae bacterium]